MTDDELKAALSLVRERMLNDVDSELSELRKENLDRYLGKPDGRERPGYSTYVTREVYEAVEWAKPSLLRIFTGSDRYAVFEAVGPEDEAQAEQETDIVNHYLQSDGFITFYEWFTDALIYPNGYAKIWTEEATTVKTERYQGLTGAQLQAIAEDDSNEIVAASARPVLLPGQQGMVPAEVYDIEVKVTCKEPKLRFQAVPPEEVGVDPETTSVNLDECRYLCHRTKRTKSELIEMGYDADLLNTVPQYKEDGLWNTERTSRHDITLDNTVDETLDDSTAYYELEEWYIQVDYDGDGVAERRRVDVIGGEIFDNIEYDYQPLVALSSIVIPHRHDGLALADSVKPIQILSTYYQRAINDNIARINRPRKYVSEMAMTDDGLTMEQLLDVDSEVVVFRDITGVMPEAHQPVIQELLAVHQSVKDQVQMRTGVAPGISLDADILKKSTEGAYSAAMNAASQLVEMIARVFAETGVKQAMLKAHRQIKEHQNQAKVLKIRGKWVETNPQDWRDRSNVTVNVGFGFSDKAQQLQSAGQLIQMQMQLLPIGMATPQLLMNSLEDFVEALGRKGVERYFQVPPPPQPGQQQPDPLTMAQIQAITAEIQRQQFKTQSEEQRQNAMTDAKLEGENAKTQKALADAAKAATEAGSAAIRAQAEMLAPQYAQDM